MKRFAAALLSLLLVGPSVAFAEQQADATKLLCPNKSPRYKGTHGLCFDYSTRAPVQVVNGQIDHFIPSALSVSVFEDFLGKDINVTDGIWAEKDTSAAGTPTLAIVADADDGVYQLTLAATDEAEIVTLYWNDELNIDTDRGPVLYSRVYVETLPSAAAEIMVWGLASAQNDTEDSVANHAWFRLEADGDLLIESDDGTTDDDDNDTAVDFAADTYYETLVDCRTPTDCDFYYRTALGGDWTELLSTTAFSIGADAAVQPFAQVSKDSGTGQPSLKLDAVAVGWTRTP
jgi:hypothetical protein